MPKCIVLFSGGLDSTTCLALATRDFGKGNVYALSFCYGQTHEQVELEQAKAILDLYGISNDQRIVQSITLAPEIKRNALFTGEIEDGDLARQQGEVAATYVPGRNMLFVAYANAFAEAIQASAIYIGVNQVDFSGYPDCRGPFIESLDSTIRHLGHGVSLKAPLLNMNKAEIASLGISLGAPLHLTHSCYRGTRPACGTCDACLLRLRGFFEAGLKDPIDYRKE